MVYSIDTLCKNITPPLTNWKTNVDTAVACGAVEIVIEVMKLHPNNEQVARTLFLGRKDPWRRRSLVYITLDLCSMWR